MTSKASFGAHHLHIAGLGGVRQARVLEPQRLVAEQTRRRRAAFRPRPAGSDTPWNWPIAAGRRPRAATRTPRFRRARRCATATHCRPISARLKSKPCMTCTKPLPSSPRRWLDRHAHVVEEDRAAADGALAMAVEAVRGDAGAVASARSSAVTPWAPTSAVPVRAKTTVTSAWSAARDRGLLAVDEVVDRRRARCAAAGWRRPSRRAARSARSRTAPRRPGASQPGRDDFGRPCLDRIWPFSEASRLR